MSKKFKIFRWLCFTAMLGCTAVLIFESCLNSKTSAGHSNAVGGEIADIYNDIKGDQTQTVEPTNVKITNKISSAYVGETYTISHETTPDNATYQSYIYQSSDTSIALVNENGVITFFKEGLVTITITNVHFNTVSDSFDIDVKPINATKIESTIDAEYIEGAYKILLGQGYLLNSVISPSNTTYKEITYTYDETYLSVSESGLITAIKESDTPISLLLSCGDAQETIYLLPYVNKPEIIDLTSISTTGENTIYVTQQVTPKITFTPSNATYKGYKLQSNNPSVVSISGTKYVGKAPGSAIITVTSTTYPDISCEIQVTVNAQPTITNFKASISSTIVEGSSKKVQITSITPQYAATGKITYASSDTSIATVDANGNVKGITPGNVTIIVTINGIQKQVQVEIVQKSLPEVDKTKDFDILYIEGEKPIVYTNCEIDLKSYFGVSKWYPEGYTPSNTNITFDITNEFASITNNVLTITKPGTYTINMTHNLSGIYKTLSIEAIDTFIIKNEDNIITNLDTLELKVSKTCDLKIDYVNYDDISKDFIFESSNPNIISITKINDLWQISGLNQGETLLSVTPVINDTIYNDHKIEININVSHIYASNMEISAVKNSHSGSLIDFDTSKPDTALYLNDTITFTVNLDNETTISKLSYAVSDNKILKISNNGLLKPLKTGNALVIIKEEYSNLTYELNVYVYNHIEIDEENPITVTGFKATYNSNNITYSITNGYAASIKVNFLECSTYTKATYQTSNDKVLTIGLDGKITPIKAGKATITITIDDGLFDEPEKIFTVNIEVKRQDMITNMAKFMYQIRKGIGHFGAFLVLGIFSSLTFLLFFRYKHYYWSVPTNIIYGFGIAALTEYIQTFVQGRYGCWSDVWLDFTGFIFSAIILSITLVSTTLIKLYLKKKKSKE